MKTTSTYHFKIISVVVVCLFYASSTANAQESKDSITIALSDTDSIKELVNSDLLPQLPEFKMDSINSLERIKDSKIGGPLQHITDSSLSPLDKLSVPFDSFTLKTSLSKLKNQFSTSKLMPALSGTVISESYATNFLDPYTRSESVYSRLYGSPSIEVLGLPFLVDFYYTTEDNSYYNSNYISLDFDINRYRQNLEQKFKQKLSDQIAAKKQSSKDLFDIAKSEQLLKKQLEAEKNKLANLDMDIKGLDLDTSVLRSAVWSKKDSLQSSATNKLQDSVDGYSARLDSLQQTENYKKGVMLKDSLEAINQKIEKLEGEIKQAQETYEKLKNIDSQLKDSVELLKKQYGSKDFLLSRLKKTDGGAKLAKVISKIESFQLGLTNPMLSEYTLNGIPVKGVYTKYGFRENDVQLAVGRTFRTEFNTFGLEQPKPIFDRNVIGVRSEQTFGKANRRSLAITSVSFFDDHTVELPKQNILHALDYNGPLGKKMELGLSLNHAVLLEEKNENTQIFVGSEQKVEINKFQNFLDHFAGEINLEYDATKFIKLEGGYKRVSPEYISLGNPFLRNNFHELDLKSKFKLFKRKFTLTTFYKKYEDNITGLSEVTNEMSGYGVSARSNFKKALNFQFQYSPYQQGNNNPDTLFQTDNQLSVISANVIYNKQLGTSNLTSILTYVNSHIDYNNGQLLVNNTMYLSSTTWSAKKANISASVSRNITGPSIDTLNFWGVRIGLMQKGGKKVNYAISSFYDGFDAGAVRHRTTLQARFNLLPKLESTLSGEFGQIKGLYGIEQKEVVGFRILLKYQL